MKKTKVETKRRKLISRIKNRNGIDVLENAYVKDGLTFFSVMGKRKITTNAAGITFYFFLSIIPFIVLLCSQLPYTGISESDMVLSIKEIVPQTIYPMVESIVGEAYSLHVALFSLSVITLIWASAKVVMATIRALDQIYGTKDGRNYFAVAGSAVLYTLVSLAATAALIFIVVKGKSAEQVMDVFFPTKEIMKNFVKTGRSLFIQFVSILIIALIYTFFPAGKRSYLKQLPGALIATVGISIVTGYVAAYNNRRNIYHSFYGSLAEIALTMIWLYFCVMIFLWGAAVNEYFKDRITRRKKEKDEAESIKLQEGSDV